MTAVAQSPPPLQAASLSLGAPAMKDLPALTAVWGDPRVARYWTGDPLSADECRAKLDGILAANAAGDCLQWGVSTEPTGALIGTCTIWKIDRGQRRAELGIAIGADHWGRGHARVALGRVLRYGFEDLQLHRLEADVDPDNAASLRLFEALGFRREGLLRQRWFMHGRWCDSVLLGLLQPEWAEYGMR